MLDTVSAGAFVQGRVGFGLGFIVLPTLVLVAPERLPHLALLVVSPRSCSLAFASFTPCASASWHGCSSSASAGGLGAGVVAIISTVVLQPLCAASVLLSVAGSAVSPPHAARQHGDADLREEPVRASSARAQGSVVHRSRCSTQG